jgi:hypothetical protein
MRLRMHLSDPCLGHFSDYSFGEDYVYIEKREIGWVTNIRNNTCRINQQWAWIGPCRFRSNLQFSCMGSFTSMAAVISVMIIRSRRADHAQPVKHDSLVAVIHV